MTTIHYTKDGKTCFCGHNSGGFIDSRIGEVNCPKCVDKMKDPEGFTKEQQRVAAAAMIAEDIIAHTPSGPVPGPLPQTVEIMPELRTHTFCKTFELMDQTFTLSYSAQCGSFVEVEQAQKRFQEMWATQDKWGQKSEVTVTDSLTGQTRTVEIPKEPPPPKAKDVFNTVHLSDCLTAALENIDAETRMDVPSLVKVLAPALMDEIFKMKESRCQSSSS